MGFGRILSFLKNRKKFIGDIIRSFLKKHDFVKGLVLATIDGFSIFSTIENDFREIMFFSINDLKKCIGDQKFVGRIIKIDERRSICYGYDSDIVAILLYEKNASKDFLKKSLSLLFDSILEVL